MIDARIFMDVLPGEASPSLILNFIEALLWYQIYHIEWNIQRVLCDFSNNRLIMKTYGIILNVEAQWRLAIPKLTMEHPWITPFLDKIGHSLKVFPVLKETLKRIERGGRWFVVSGRTPTIQHKPEYVELVYKIHSIEYLIWMLENLIEIEKEEANKIQGNVKHDDESKSSSNEVPSGNEVNSTAQASPPIEPSIEPPAQDENIRVSTDLSPYIDVIIDELIKEINWCGDELDEGKEKKSIQAGLKTLARIDPWRYSTSVKQKHRRIDMLSVDEKNELMKRLTDITDYIIELFPGNDIIGFE